MYKSFTLRRLTKSGNINLTREQKSLWLRKVDDVTWSLHKQKANVDFPLQ